MVIVFSLLLIISHEWLLCTTLSSSLHTFFMATLTNRNCLAMNFVSPSSIIAETLNHHVQVIVVSNTDWLAVIQSLQTL